MVDLSGNSFKYKAFLSYNRADRDVARQIQAQLEAFVLPPSLRAVRAEGSARRRPVNPIFRDETELVAGTDLPQRIETALGDSEFLIVVASPAAARSEWVEKEILSFARLGKADNILTVVVDGDGDPRFAATHLDPLPRALRHRLTPHGGISGDPTEPLWIDWRNKADRRTSLLRLVAALLRLESVDDLLRRDMVARRRSARRWVASGVTLALLAIAALATMIGMERSAARREALVLAQLARSAADAGDFKKAARYALLSASRGRNRLIPFTTPESEVELRNAALQAPRPLNRFRLRTGLSAVRFLDDGRTILAATPNAVFVVNAETGTILHARRGFGSNVAEVFVSGDKSRFLVVTAAGAIHVFDSATRAQVAAWAIPNFTANPDNISTHAVLSPDGRRLSAFKGDTVWRWADVTAAPFVQRVPGRVSGLSPDGRYAIVNAQDDPIPYEFDLNAQARLGNLPINGEVSNATYSGDSQLLSLDVFLADAAAQLYLFKRNSEFDQPPFHLHSVRIDTQYYDYLRTLSVAAAGDRLFTGWNDMSSDSRLLDWIPDFDDDFANEADTAAYRVLAESRGSPFAGADVSRNRTRVVSATENGRVTLWNVISFDPPRELQWGSVTDPSPPPEREPFDGPVHYDGGDQPYSFRRPDGSVIRRLARDETEAEYDPGTATVAISQGQVISFYDSTDGTVKFRITRPPELAGEIPEDCPPSVAFLPSDRARVMVGWCIRKRGYLTAIIRLQTYEVPSARPIGSLSPEALGALSLRGYDITPDGRYALVESDPQLHSGPVILDIATGRRVGYAMTWLPERGVRFGPDGQSVLAIVEPRRDDRRQVSWTLDPFYFVSFDELFHYACTDLLSGGFDRLTRAEMEAAPFLDPERDAAVCEPRSRTWFSI